MQAPNWTDFLQCSICTSKFDQSDVLPVSLNCGHTLCMRCLGKLKTRTCPYDKVAIRSDVEVFPINAALLHLLGHKQTPALDNIQVQKLCEADQALYNRAMLAVFDLSMFLQPLAEHGISAAITYLTKPMLKKLVSVVNCQILECDGQVRALRAAHSIADRTVTELLVMHQNQQQISTLLWTAVRNRGCQFLGPVMQEEALKLILLVLESGNSLSRKNIVLFVVQRLSNDFPQASKTSVGHVVQLLYRASCFNVEKRDDDSSLMQLKEEFRSYECLRREHDGQIIRMAMEAGLRISPEQWSTLLYGDHKHKSDMQSIIDKLISQGAASSGLSELIVAVGRSQDPYQLSEKVVPHLETIFRVSIGPDKNSEIIVWETFAAVMEALLATLHGFSTFMQIQNGRFKTGMCPHLTKAGGCPKGDRCTYAHSEEERDRFRNMVKPAKPVKPRSGEQFCRPLGRNGSRSGDHGPTKAHTDTHPSLSTFQSGPSSAPEHFICYPGDMRTHPASLTAPVLTNQDWHAIPRRGVATVDHTYHPNENGLSSYHSNEQVYSKPLPTEPLPSYAVNQGLSMIRLQHEAVKQSIEGSAYPRELLPDSAAAAAAAYVSTPRYSQRDWIPAPIESQTLHPSPYTHLTAPEHYSVPQTTEELQQQVLTSGMERIEISGPPSTFSSSGSSSYPGDSYPQTANTPAVSSNVSCSTNPTTTTTTTTTGGEEGVASNTSNADEMQAEIERLREQLRKKDETIQQQNVQLHYSTGTATAKPTPVKPESTVPPPTPQYSTSLQGNAQFSTPLQGNAQYSTPLQGNLQYSTPLQGNAQFSTPLQGNAQYSTPLQGNAQYSTPLQGNAQFSTPVQGNTQFSTPLQGNMQFSTPLQGNTQFSTHLQRNTQFSTPLQGNGQYSGTIQQMYSNGVLVGEDASQPLIHSHGYTAKQLQAAAMAAALVGGSQSSATPYYPPAPPPAVAAAPSYPVHWSGPVQTTPPSTGYIMSAPALPHQVVLPSSTPPQHPMMDHSDDGMLAAYIQMVEQSKASAHTYQTTPTYNPPTAPPQVQGHYYYRH